MNKRYILFFILLLCCIINVNASTNTLDRNTLDNYGVNKKIKGWPESDILGTPAVDASEKIYDFSDVISEDDEIKLYESIKEYREETGMEMVFLSTSFTYISDSINEYYAVNFYDYNDFGLDIDHYSGVIIFLNSIEGNSYFGIYTFGEAQLYYSDDICSSIRSNAYQELHGRDFYNGVTKVISSLKNYYKKGYAPEYKHSYIDEMGYISKRYYVPWFIALIVSTIGTIVIMSILISKNKMIRKEYKASEYLIKNSVTYTKKEDRFITSHTSSYTTSSSSGGHSSGGSRSGSSGRGHGGSGGHI